MANSIYGSFGGNQNAGNMNDVLNDPQINQKFQGFVQGLNDEIRNAPQQTVQQLLSSGQMSQKQFEFYRQMANRLTGKNY